MENVISIGRMIRMLHHKIDKYVDINLAPFGINHTELGILLYLFKNKDKEINQKDIVKVVKIHKGNVSRGINHLIEMDYIMRLKDPQDGRNFIIELTEKAIIAEPGFISMLSGITSTLTKNFTEKQIEDSTKMLNRMIQNISESIL